MDSQRQHARSGHEPEYGEGPIGLERAYELGGGGAHGHLREAGPAGGGAGHAGVDADGACRAVGNGEAVAEGRQRHGEEQCCGRELAGDGGREAEETAEHRDHAARHDHAVNAEFLGVEAGEEIPEHVAQGYAGEPDAIFQRCALEDINHDVGGAAEKCEEHRRGETEGERVVAKARQGEQLAGIAEEVLLVGVAGGVGFGQRNPGGDEHDCPQRGQQPEAAAPVGIILQRAAQHRGHHGGHHKGHGDIGDDAGGFFPREHVAHHGAGQYNPCRSANGLNEAGRDEELYCGGNCCEQAGHEKQGQASQQQGPSAKPVGSRAIDELADSHADEIEREGKLNSAIGHAKGFLEARHGRDHQVERQGADGGDRHQNGEGGAGRCFGDGGHGRALAAESGLE